MANHKHTLWYNGGLKLAAHVQTLRIRYIYARDLGWLVGWSFLFKKIRGVNGSLPYLA